MATQTDITPGYFARRIAGQLRVGASTREIVADVRSRITDEAKGHAKREIRHGLIREVIAACEHNTAEYRRVILHA